MKPFFSFSKSICNIHAPHTLRTFVSSAQRHHSFFHIFFFARLFSTQSAEHELQPFLTPTKSHLNKYFVVLFLWKLKLATAAAATVIIIKQTFYIQQIHQSFDNWNVPTMNQLIKNLFLLSLCLLNQTFGDVQSASNHRDFSPRLLASTALMKEYNNNADSGELMITTFIVL